MDKIFKVFLILVLGITGFVASLYMLPMLRSVAGTAVNTSVNASEYYFFSQGLNLGPFIVLLFLIVCVVGGVWLVVTGKI